ncbi:MAG: hypothetical protein AAF479_17465, partial [Pseudomonadota bacterium]
PRTRITTNGLDCVNALQHLGVQRPFLVFPPWFTDAPISAGIGYFEALGFQVGGHVKNTPDPKWDGTAPADLYASFMHLEQNVETLRRQIEQSCPKEADGVLIVGTGLRCVGIIDGLEQSLDRPVVTANQASLWRCLNLAGVKAEITGYGSLLS